MVSKRVIAQKDSYSLPVEPAAIKGSDQQSLCALNTRPSLEREFQAASPRPYEATKQLLSGFSHDLRGPLTVIVGFVEVLNWGIAGDLNEKQKELIDHIRHEALSLCAVADRIQHHGIGA